MPDSPFWLKQGWDEVRPCVPFKAVPCRGGADPRPKRPSSDWLQVEKEVRIWGCELNTIARNEARCTFMVGWARALSCPPDGDAALLGGQPYGLCPPWQRNLVEVLSVHSVLPLSAVIALPLRLFLIHRRKDSRTVEKWNAVRAIPEGI